MHEIVYCSGHCDNSPVYQGMANQLINPIYESQNIHCATSTHTRNYDLLPPVFFKHLCPALYSPPLKISSSLLCCPLRSKSAA